MTGLRGISGVASVRRWSAFTLELRSNMELTTSEPRARRPVSFSRMKTKKLSIS